ncbi:MAG: chromosomal replication initiator protein DnaA [SAR86 cluster bacterium]|uniref:Chromosomal replication initiator protein DnaA n=1 Tax=SAR86 cluster bacterium TaxID=2030880 RepID=A0A2A5CI46_9GAMM|nr:MAG: chromosomal replication initiator protein DnaA [SAR86 cluster bacterium]
MIVATWQKCIYCLKNELPAQQFNTWIRPLKIIAEKAKRDVDTEGTGKEALYLLAPNKFVLEWVKDNFLDRIMELMEELSAQNPPSIHLDVTNNFDLKEAISTADLSNLQAPDNFDEAGHYQSTVLDIDSPGRNSNNTPGNNIGNRGFHNQNFNEYKPKAFQKSAERAGSGQSNTALNQGFSSAQTYSTAFSNKLGGRLRYKGELNKNYTFNNFIEGKSNQLARAAAAQVADNPGGAYNPLFIYGGVGLGKTHLMHSIGNHLLKQNPNANVVYLHSQTFVGSMVSALQLNAINEFKRYYHSVDALLIDDIQFFANKERSQEEFFHTFNAIFEGGRQIIMTCDKYHSEINGLEERLKSRFGWGLSVAVEPPDLETRAAILINKANRENVFLPNQEAMFMAQKLRSNVRELEGALKKVIAHARFTGSEISVPLIKEALKDLLAIQNKLISVDNIQRTVAEYYKIKMTDMISKRRNRSIARPRQIAMCLSKDLTNHSLPEIGTMYGDRDHTTVLHACRRINELKKSSSDIYEDYQNLLRSLSS